MTTITVPPRSEVPRERTWNAESVFESVEAWQAEAAQMPALIEGLREHEAAVREGPAGLLKALRALEAVWRRLGKLSAYTEMAHNVDTTDQTAARMYAQAQGLWGQASARASFLDPALLALGRETLEQWAQAEPELQVYAHYIDNLFRRQAHVRSAEVEEVLGLARDPFAATSATYGMLTDADFKFKPAVASTGEALPLTQGSRLPLLHSPDRETRRTAWENYLDTYLAHKHTLASNLAASIRQNVFYMRARRYHSTLEASLFENNVPEAVFHNLIETFRRNLPTWHRYWRVRRRALGLDSLHPYDVTAPLAEQRVPVSYEQAVDWICEGMAPLGEEYVSVLRRGCLEDRWVDVYPNQGKGEGAFSAGAPGTHPFILMSYSDSLTGLSTLAHELGHSMHSYLTWQNQPLVYTHYSLFVAEVASNFNQAMVRAHLLKTQTGRPFQIGVLEEAMANFHRYFFIMPTLARFELEVHQRIERGQGVTADDMIGLMADLFSEGYGDEVVVDRDRVGIIWATFGHLYADYYVYQYATGISGANLLAQRILSGTPGAAEAYVNFLKAGASLYPLDALKQAGVDLSTPEPVETTFAVLADYVGRLEALFATSPDPAL